MGVSIECCVLSVEAGKANCIAWQDRGSKTRSITLDWTTLAIKPPMDLQQYWQYREGGQIKSATKLIYDYIDQKSTEIINYTIFICTYIETE